DVSELAGASVMGSALGLGLGLMLPSADTRLRMALADGTGLVALASALYYAPLTHYQSGDYATASITGAIGGGLGAFLPVLWNSRNQAPGEQTAGGMVFGSTLGVATGLALSQIVPVEGTQRKYLSLGAGVGALSGAGLG